MNTLSNFSHNTNIIAPIAFVRSIKQIKSSLHPVTSQEIICIHRPLSRVHLFKDQTYITVSDIFITSYRDFT